MTSATSDYLNRPLRRLAEAESARDASPFEAVDVATDAVVASSRMIGLAIAAGRRAVPLGAIEIRRGGKHIATIGVSSTNRGADPRALIASGVSP